MSKLFVILSLLLFASLAHADMTNSSETLCGCVHVADLYQSAVNAKWSNLTKDEAYNRVQSLNPMFHYLTIKSFVDKVYDDDSINKQSFLNDPTGKVSFDNGSKVFDRCLMDNGLGSLVGKLKLDERYCGY